METLTGALRHYPWGSRTLLAELTGRSIPAPRPEAEVWFGAHPTGSALLGSGPLVESIAADPESSLGGRVRRNFGDELPFLLKLLAADQPLSLQAHPTREQAVEGCAREEAAGVPLDAPGRNYRDANHKPELIVAVTEFEALAGFRPVAATRELLAALDVPELEHYTVLLDGAGPEGAGPEGGRPADGAGTSDADALRALFTTWITLPVPTVESLVAAVAEAAARTSAGTDPEWIRLAARSVAAIAARYPGDVGVLGALLLNRITLRPGEGIFLGAGQLHAYLSGLGVEVMANSDNVLRGGLTSKHVDVPELLRVLDFQPNQNPVVVPQERRTDGGQGYLHYPVPVDEFDLDRVELGRGDTLTLGHDGPVLILTVAGASVTQPAGTDLEVSVLASGPGEAVWIAAQDGPVAIRCADGAEAATVFVATVGAGAV